ncbi:hypothetical protein VNO77_03983 [Canavalia gladiata]|uniref:Uncharacterized protein n=1 Tax=Canavalia gladiata TaxID=3824 RepID=A0AAN9RCR1_CANGL
MVVQYSTSNESYTENHCNDKQALIFLGYVELQLRLVLGTRKRNNYYQGNASLFKESPGSLSLMIEKCCIPKGLPSLQADTPKSWHSRRILHAHCAPPCEAKNLPPMVQSIVVA